MYKIRACSDISIIKKLQKECLPDCPYYLSDTCKWWVVWYWETPVGFYGWEPMEDHCKTVYICRCGVLEKHRGLRLQKRMTRIALICAKLNGYLRAVTDTRQNPPSANSFISSGFKTFEPKKPWAFKDSIYWFKDL